MTPNMVRRIAFAAVAIPSVIAVAWVGSWALAALLAVAAALGARELYDLARKQGIEPLVRLGMIAAAAVPFAVLLPLRLAGQGPQLIREGYLFLVFVLVLLLFALARRSPQEKPLTSVAITLFGVLYAGWLPSFALLLRHPLGVVMPGARVGMALLFFPLVVTWVGDSAAMTAGRAFGGAKMAPVVSPNKTWAGGVGGLFGSVAIGLIYAAVIFRRLDINLSLGAVLLFAAIISVVGQAGDVAESLMKREVGVKDSSTLLPGHGGVLDRLDSLYFVLPVTSLLYRLAGVA